MSCTVKAPNRNPQSSRLLSVLGLLYILLIVYCSLLPWLGWRVPEGEPLSFLGQLLLQASRGQILLNFLVNVLAYIPLGLLLIGSTRRTGWRTALLATAAGGAMSMAVETLQWYVPGRDQDVLDIVANTLGTMLGAMSAESVRSMPRIQQRALRVLAGFHSGPVVRIGLCALGLWALSELSPFVPVLHRAALMANLSPLTGLLSGSYTFRPIALAAYASYMTGALLFVGTMQKNVTSSWTPAAVAAGVLLLKPFVHKQQLSLEALAGLAVGAAVQHVFTSHRLRTVSIVSMCLLSLGFIAYEIEPRPGGLEPFNWIPFSAQNAVRLSSFGTILATVWPFLALGCLGVRLSQGRNAWRYFTVGTVTGLAVVCGLEYLQMRIPGRYGDITTVILAGCAWAVPWFLSGSEERDCKSYPPYPDHNRYREAGH